MKFYSLQGLILLAVAGLLTALGVQLVDSSPAVVAGQSVPVVGIEPTTWDVGVTVQLDDGRQTVVTVPTGTPVGTTIDVVAPTDTTATWMSVQEAGEAAAEQAAILGMVALGAAVIAFLGATICAVQVYADLDDRREARARRRELVHA